MRKMLTAFTLCFFIAPPLALSVDGHDKGVMLFPSCTTCKNASEISLVAYLENQSIEPVIVYGRLGWGELGGFVLHVEDAAGNEVAPKSNDDEMIVPSTLDDPAYYVAIQPHQGLGKRRIQPVRELFPHSGKYTIWVTYQSPVPMRLALRKEGFLSREQGKITSEKINITVQ